MFESKKLIFFLTDREMDKVVTSRNTCTVGSAEYGVWIQKDKFAKANIRLLLSNAILEHVRDGEIPKKCLKVLQIYFIVVLSSINFVHGENFTQLKLKR